MRPTPPIAADIRPRAVEPRVARAVEPPLPTPVATSPPEMPPAARSTLAPELQEKVNKAVAAGLKHLQEQQKPSGTWLDKQPVALAALPGLTLLECGVAANDERVQKAAKYVREHIAKADTRYQTYTFSLVVLFLDRLGEERDRPLIRTLALRLLAGQQADGGWGYSVPELSARDQEKLMRALTATRPRELAKLIKTVEAPRALERITRDDAAAPAPDLGPARPESPPKSEAPSEEEARRAVRDLPEALRSIPAVSDDPRTKPGRPAARPGKRPAWPSMNTDNSNTQFAALALWASLRQGVPAERAMRHLAERFRNTQRADGGWNYVPSTFGVPPGTPAMTGVGLLGLGIGHGLGGEVEKKALDDEQVKHGLKALGGSIGRPGTKQLYFLWTLERVGVLYGVREIGGKDWYAHSVDVLLHAQQWNGAWDMGGYHGSHRMVDTCLALLILKRANFAAELTRHLEGGLIWSKPDAPPLSSR